MHRIGFVLTIFSIAASCAPELLASDGDTAASLRPGEQTEKPAKFPKALCKTGVGGIVPLRVAVDGVGRPYDIRIEQTSGTRELDRAAVEAAKHWRYLPALVAGKKKGGIARFSVEFDPQSDGCRKIIGR